MQAAPEKEINSKLIERLDKVGSISRPG